jgi:hypothetical protein
MTKAQRHKAEASRARREADRLQGMAYCARNKGKNASASLLLYAAERRMLAAQNHEQAFVKELAA